MCAAVVSAQNTQSARLRGRVLDATGAVLVDADVKVFQTNPAEAVKQAKTNNTGDFDLALAPGEYTLEVSAPDFETHREVVRVAPNMKALSVSLSLAGVTTTVDASDDPNQVSVGVDPDASLTAQTISGNAVEDLPEDEDQLAAYLQELAGARGGAGGQGSFVIDGFSGGRVPPRDQIQEIRINNTPFSAEFSGQGFGRIEIVTRAGTGNWTGGMNFNFRDESLNAKNPFAASKPPYQVRNFNTQFSGPLIPNRLTLRFRGQNNETDNSDTIRAITSSGSINTPTVSPQTNRGINTGGQLTLTKNNSLNFNANFNTNKRLNQGVGGFNLAERASNSMSHGMELQVRETAIIGTTLVHETRFEFNRDTNSQTPLTNGVAINVLDSFFGGGAQNRSNSKNRTYEFGDLLIWTHPKVTFKSGFQGNYIDNHNVSENNFIGVFTFSSLSDYLADRPATFTQTTGNPLLDLTQFELGTFVQTDWKLKPQLTLSAGLRYEAQTNLSDYNNFDPRFGFAYQITKTTVIRGGGGVFHQRLNVNNVDQLIRLDGTRQQQIVIRNPSYPNPFLGGSASLFPTSLRVRAEDLAAPYNMNSSITLEQKVSNSLGMTLSFDTVRGVHLLRLRNINAPLPGILVRPDPSKGNINQLESTGKSFSKNVSIGFRENLPTAWNLNVFGNYTLGWNNNDTDGAFNLPANNYDLASEWGRSPQDTRHRFQAGVNVRLPWNVNSNLFIQANSGRPFNITTGFDDNGDTVTNDRPAGVRRNSGDGPSTYNLNLNLSRTFNLRPPESRQNRDAANGAGNSFAQRGGGGGFPGPPGGQFPGGGFPGGQRGGPQGGPGGREGQQRPGGFGNPNGPRLTFNISMNNLLNNTQLRSYSGVQTSPFYGKANQANNGRSIVAGLNLNF